MGEKLVLIDGHSILNRAFYGLPDLTNSEGLHTNAVYGFLNILFKILEEEKPQYLAVAFDVHAPTFRHRMFEGYKGTRKPMAEELRQQVPLMKDLLRAMGVLLVEKEGYEADDILGTLSARAEAEGMEVSVISGDRDLLQLATDSVRIRIPKTKRTGTEIENYYADDVRARYLVSPREFIDVKALMGDSSDNIPGVPGIGEKTATALIEKYKSIEAVHEDAANVRPPRASKNIQEFWDQAVMSKELATIVTDVPIETSFSDAKLENGIDGLFTADAFLLCKRLEFKNLLGRFGKQKKEGKRTAAPEGNPSTAYLSTEEGEQAAASVTTEQREHTATDATTAQGEQAAAGVATAQGEQSTADVMKAQKEWAASSVSMSDGMQTAASVPMTDREMTPVIMPETVRITEWEEALRLWEKAKGRRLGVAVIRRSNTGDPHREADGQMNLFAADQEEPCLGMAIAFGDEDCYYLETGEQFRTSELFGLLERHEGQVCTFDLKGLLASMESVNDPKERMRYRDVTIAAYLLNPLKGSYPCEVVAGEYLGLELPSSKDLLGKNTPEQLAASDPDKLVRLCGSEAFAAWRLAPVLEERLREQGMEQLYNEIEMPVSFVLSDMEKEGICMDADALTEYGKELSASITDLEKQIWEEAGEKFNINSPKQLGAILFEKIKLPHGKKTKTGYSTSVEVLEKLAGDHPIVSKILEYRQLAKLKSTYADGLVQFVAGDGKIHSTFNQTITATGRLSSTDPNLQNIPIRIELGKRIRKVFQPSPGHVFVDSDYSQIELRVLAHMSGDEKLIQAFQENQDIHRITASQVFHVPMEEVTPLQRRNAKAVNFGIVYGISAYGLSQDLDISRTEAKEYIDGYYETFPKIREFLDNTVKVAKKQGAIRTMFARIRPIPELKSANFAQRQFGERVAMNSPIQGTAADIIKIAMVRVHDRLWREGLSSRLILQVHDELLVDAAEAELDTVKAILEQEMENAVSLKVKMDVGTEIGYNWYEAH